MAVGRQRGWNAVTEISASTGRLIATRPGRRYGFDHPAALAVSNGRLWVANSLGDSVTEVNAATGALLRRCPATGTASATRSAWPPPAETPGSPTWARTRSPACRSASSPRAGRA
jgi:DNA-binding beta-propeller fold protein YncE